MFGCMGGEVWMGRVGGQVLVGMGVSGLPGELTGVFHCTVNRQH